MIIAKENHAQMANSKKGRERKCFHKTEIMIDLKNE